MFRIDLDPKNQQEGTFWWQWCILNQTLNDPRLRKGFYAWCLLWLVLFGGLGWAVARPLPRDCAVTPTEVMR